MLRHTFVRSSRLGPTRPPGVRVPGGLSRSVPHTIGCAKRDDCAVRRVNVPFSPPPIAASCISAAATAESASRAWLQCRGTVSVARTCAVACQRRTITFSYCDRVPCIRFDMSTERLARATAQPTLPANANIFMIDVRKGQRKSKRVNPKSTMASIITAHRAEAQKAKEELDKDDAYTPPLIFLFRTDDTKKQAARRQEQMDVQLDALGAFGEFRACVLDGIKSRHWTRYIDSPTTPDRPTPAKAESASSRNAPHTASVAAAVAAAVDPAVVPPSGAGDALASLFRNSGGFAGSEGKSRTGTAEAPVAAVSPRASAAGAAEGSAGAAKEADDVEGEDEEVWEEVEVDEGEEAVEGDDGGGGGTNSAADDNGAGASQSWETATCVDHTAVLSMPAKEARPTTPADAKIITAPSTAKRSVNTVWAHVKSQTPSGGSTASAAALVAAAEASSRKHENTAEEDAVDVADLDGDDVTADAASPAVPSLADPMDNADGVSITDAPRRSGPESDSDGRLFLATAHAPPLAEPAPLTRSTDAEALLSLEELEEFDIDGPMSETITAGAPAEAAVSALADATPEALSTATTKDAESSAAEHFAAISVSGGDDITAPEEAAGEASASNHISGPAALDTAAESLTEVLQEDAAACVAAGAADDGPTLTASEGDSAHTEVEVKDAEEEAVSTTAAEDSSNAAAFSAAAPAPPVSPPKPSISMPVYPEVVSRLYYGATTVHLSDRAFIELPATANVLVIDHLDWDDAHLAAIEAALEQVDPVAGHVLLYPDAYAPQSEHVMGDINTYRRSLLPFIFVFRTQLSTEVAMAVQRRLANALHVRPTLDSAAQQSLVAGQNDRTSVCVLSAAESEKGGENPMLAPQPRKATPASPRRAVDAPVRESSTAATAAASPLHRTPPAATEGQQRGGNAGGATDNAVQLLWDLLNSVSFDASSSKKSAASVAAPSAQVEVQRSHHGGCNGNGGAAAERRQRIPAPGASSARGSADKAEPVNSCPAGTTTNITTSTSDTRETSHGHITANTVVDDATLSQPSRLAYAPSLLNSEVAAPFLSASARADAAGGADAARQKFPATTLLAESADVHGSTAMIKGGLFNFGAITFGRDSGYYTTAVPRLRRASGSRWGMNDDDDDVDGEHNATDAADGAATSSTLGSVSDLGLYPVSESVAATRAEAARISRQNGGGSPFTDEEIAKIEEEIILAQLRKKERKERRSEARRAMRAKAKEAKSQFACKTASSSSPVSSAPSTPKGSRLWKQRLPGSRNGSDSSKETATAREQELAEDSLLEDFISSLLVKNNRSKGPKTNKVKVSVSSAPSRGVLRSARRTLATPTPSTRRGVKQ